MRADRLVATLLVMQARGQVTAADVAREMEVSVATARRDLQALSTAGVPVYAVPGRGGGWRLVDGARTDLTGLTSPEVRALFVLLGPSASISPEARAAVRKLVQALPAAFRPAARSAAQSVHIDPAQWGSPPAQRSDRVGELQGAIIDRRQVTMRYSGWDTASRQRVVDPWGLIQKGDNWYLIGTDGGRLRTYRLDRITALEPLDEPTQRPDNIDLAAVWGSVVEDVARRRSATVVEATVSSMALPWLRTQFGPDNVEVLSAGKAPWQIRIAAPNEQMIARSLLGWSGHVTEVSPQSLRTELARLAAIAVECHAGDRHR